MKVYEENMEMHRIRVQFSREVSVRSSQKIKGFIVESSGEGEEPGSRVRSMIRVMCLIRSTVEIGFQLEYDPPLM